MFFLNSGFFHECADAFTARLEKAGLDWWFKAAYGRPAADEEMAIAERLREKAGDMKPVARMLLAANPFVFVE